MKSALRQEKAADFISSEAGRRRFHPSLLGFHRGEAMISFLFPYSTKTVDRYKTPHIVGATIGRPYKTKLIYKAIDAKGIGVDSD